MLQNTRFHGDSIQYPSRMELGKCIQSVVPRSVNLVSMVDSVTPPLTTHDQTLRKNYNHLITYIFLIMLPQTVCRFSEERLKAANHIYFWSLLSQIR